MMIFDADRAQIAIRRVLKQSKSGTAGQGNEGSGKIFVGADIEAGK